MHGEKEGHIQPFPATNWSLVRRAGVSNGADARLAMDVLLRRYLPALRARLVCDRRLDPDAAADLLQGFVAQKVLEQELLRRAEPGRGRFRTFILTALDRYVVDQCRHRVAKRHSPGSAPQPLSELHPSTADTPADAFDRAWAREVIAEAVRCMEAECGSSGRPDVWGVFQARILMPCIHGAPPLPYDQLVARFGLRSPEHASNVLMTAKRMFARALRAVVGDYATDAGEVEREIADLRAILTSAGAGTGGLPRI